MQDSLVASLWKGEGPAGPGLVVSVALEAEGCHRPLSLLQRNVGWPGQETKEGQALQSPPLRNVPGLVGCMQRCSGRMQRCSGVYAADSV